MADDDLKIEVSAPGAKQATRDLKGVAAAEQEVGRAGREGGDEAAGGADRASTATDGLSQSMGGAKDAASVLKGMLGAAGVGMALGKFVGLMKGVHEELVRINNEIAETSRLEADRMLTAAGVLTTPAVREAARMTGWTATEVKQRGVQARMQYGVEEGDYYQILKSLYAAPLNDDQRTQMMEEAMTLWPAEAVGGATAPQLGIALATQYSGGDTQAGRRQLLGQFAAGAGASMWSSQDFTEAMLTAGPELSSAGLSFEQQMGWYGGMSGALPSQSNVGTQALLRIARLSLRENSPMLQKLLGDAGFDPNSGQPMELLSVITGYVQGGASQAERDDRKKQLSADMAIPVESIGAMVLMATPAARQAEAKVLAAVQAGTYAQIEARAEEVLSQPEHGVNAAEAARGLPDLAMGTPGSQVEAERLLEIGLGQVSAVTGPQLEAYKEEWVHFRDDVKGSWGGREAPEGDDLKELFRLNKLYPSVRSALERVAGEDTLRGRSWVGIGGHAAKLRHELFLAKRNANKWNWIGTQKNSADIYRSKMEEAILWLRQLGMNEYMEVARRSGRDDKWVPGTQEEQRAAQAGIQNITQQGAAAGGAAGRGDVTNIYQGTTFVGQHADQAGQVQPTGLE